MTTPRSGIYAVLCCCTSVGDALPVLEVVEEKSQWWGSLLIRSPIGDNKTAESSRSNSSLLQPQYSKGDSSDNLTISRARFHAHLGSHTVIGTNVLDDWEHLSTWYSAPEPSSVLREKNSSHITANDLLVNLTCMRIRAVNQTGLLEFNKSSVDSGTPNCRSSSKAVTVC